MGTQSKRKIKLQKNSMEPKNAKTAINARNAKNEVSA